MITLTILIIIWFIISVFKIFYEYKEYNFFYHAGVVIGGVVIAAMIIFLSIKFLP